MMQMCIRLVALVAMIVNCNGLGPRIYSGSLNLGVLSLEINIIAGYGSMNATKDGVNVTLTGSSLTDKWIGVGFASGMNNAPALICAGGSSTPQERQLGPPSTGGAGNPVMSPAGTGTCQPSGAPELTWEVDGYMFGDNLFTFPSDGTPVSIIWAHGTSSSFAYHGQANKGKGSITFTCQGKCTEPTPTTSPVIAAPTTSPVIMPTSQSNSINIIISIFMSLFCIMSL